MRGRMTRSIYSVTCSAVMLGFCSARYMMANCWPVPLTMVGSSASEGSWLRTCCTFDITSVSAASGSEPSRICTVTTLADGRLCDET